MLVNDVLRHKGAWVATVLPTVTLAEVAEQLREHGVGAVVVSAGESMVDGIISERAIVRALAETGPSSLDQKVSDFMATEVFTCTPTDNCEELMSVMTERRIRHLPVLDEGRMAGIISIGDLVKARLDELEREKEALETYISTGR